jgi:hypothetical protein
MQTKILKKNQFERKNFFIHLFLIWKESLIKYISKVNIGQKYAKQKKVNKQHFQNDFQSFDLKT